MDGERPHRFTALGSAAFADSIMDYCSPTSAGIPGGQDKNVAQLGWQTKSNMGCAAREPEPAGCVLSNALLIPGSPGASWAAAANPNRKSATRKQRVLKSTVTSQISTEKEVRWLEENPEGRGLTVLMRCLSDTVQSERSTLIGRNETHKRRVSGTKPLESSAPNGQQHTVSWRCSSCSELGEVLPDKPAEFKCPPWIWRL